MRATRQHLVSLEQDARELRLATEADVPTYTWTRKRAEDAASYKAKHGNNCSAKKVDPDLVCLTSFGDDSTESPALPPCRDDAIVDKGATASKPCLSPVVMRTPTAAGGLLPAGAVSTAMRTIFSRPLLSWTLGEETKERTSRTNKNQLAPPTWKKAIQMNSRQALFFYLGGCTGRLRGYPFLGGRYALRIEWAQLDDVMVAEAAASLVHEGVEHHFQERTSDSYVLRLIAVSLKIRLIRETVKVRRDEAM